MIDENEIRYLKLASLGDFYRLDINFNLLDLHEQLTHQELHWPQYNSSKPGSNRFGLSLFSLNGEISGEVDLNSIREWNQKHGTHYTEASFRTPTPYWSRITHLSQPLAMLEPHLGRTHVIRLGQSGFFPPHRDSYQNRDVTFRLISFINCSSSTLHLALDGKLINFYPGVLYYMNTRKVHSLFNFEDNAFVLVLNVILTEDTERFVMDHLLEK